MALAPQRGRAAAALLVGGYFLLLDRLGGYDAWGRFGIPPMNPNLWFADLRSVTSAWDCVRRGEPLMPVNPCDSWGRPTIYPDVWLLPRHVGLGEEHTVVLGLLILAFFFLAALAVVPAGASFKAGAVYGAALCSPAVMLGVERGNVDVLLFALIVLAVLLAARPVASAAVLLLGAVLKLYTVFGIGFLARRPERRYRLAAGAVVAGFAIYLVATWSSISATLKAVPQGDNLSYGVRRTSEWVAALLHQHSVPRLWDAVVLAAVAAVVLLARPWLRIQLGVRAGDAASRRDLDLFWAGAGVYVGSFAVLRSFDYRLVFLLLTLPQLLRWAAARRAIAVVTLLALFGALWLDPGWSGVPGVGSVLETWSRATAHLASGQPFPAAVVAQIVLFAGLLSGLVATAPSLRRSLDHDEAAGGEERRRGREQRSRARVAAGRRAGASGRCEKPPESGIEQNEKRSRSTIAQLGPAATELVARAGRTRASAAPGFPASPPRRVAGRAGRGRSARRSIRGGRAGRRRARGARYTAPPRRGVRPAAASGGPRRESGPGRRGGAGRRKRRCSRGASA